MDLLQPGVKLFGVLSPSDLSTEDDPTASVVTNETLNRAVKEMTDLLLEEEVFSVAKEIGRQLRWGELESLGLLEDVPSEFQIIDTPGFDIFGQPLTKKYNFECECPKCHRTLAAARFAPHLEKCMGMGRNSSRIASRRLASGSSSGGSSSNSSSSNNTTSDKNSGINNNSSGSGSNSQFNGDMGSEDEHFVEEDEDDEEWTMEKKKKPKKTNDKGVKKKGALNRVREAGRGRRGASPSIPSNADHQSANNGNNIPTSLATDAFIFGDDEDLTHLMMQ